MKLYIQVENGAAIGHPALEQNLLDSFNSIPEDWVPFTRILQPSSDVLPVGVYQVLVSTYVLDDDGISWKDHWSVRDMTEQEKTDKINNVLSNKPFLSWTFDESVCSFIPPVPYPNDEKVYYWDEQQVNWININ